MREARRSKETPPVVHIVKANNSGDTELKTNCIWRYADERKRLNTADISGSGFASRRDVLLRKTWRTRLLHKFVTVSDTAVS
jgi:hypothetical protein